VYREMCYFLTSKYKRGGSLNRLHVKSCVR